MLSKAYSLVSVKDFDPVKRTFSGIATSPVADRVGDIIESSGVTYKNPLPLHLYHDSRKPVGEARFSKANDGGTPFTALISTLDRESGIVKERLDEAIDSLAAKPPLIRGVSIGFRPLEDPEYIKETGGFRFTKIEVLELSMVSIPAHQDATIATVKSLDVGRPAATGTQAAASDTPRARGTVRVIPTQDASMKKTIQEQIKDFENTRAAKVAERDGVQTKASDEGRAKDDAEREQFQALTAEIKAIDDELVDLRDLEKEVVAKAAPVAGDTADEASRSRAGGTRITVAEPQLQKGIRFARYVACKAAAAMALKEGEFVTPMDLAKQRYPSDTVLHKAFDPATLRAKAAVAGSTTFTSNNLSDLVPYQVLESDFIEYLRGKTIIDQFGRNGIPSLRRVPFNVRVGGLSGGTTGYWKGEGKPVTVSKATSTNVTLTWATVAGLTAITKELARHSTPSAEMALRNDLGDAVITRMDIDFVDPSKAAVANTSPASITNAIVATAPSGTAAVNVRKDAATLYALFATANLGRSNLVWIMSDTMLGNIQMMVNALGNADFPSLNNDPPRLFGHPVIASEKLTSLGSPSTQMIVLVKADEVYLADDGGVDVEVSDTASIEMLDASLQQDGTVGTGASLVSLWQSGMLGLMASRVVTWKLRRSTAVQYISPAAYAPPSS
jgi:HK97 family phage major capsid protein